MYLFFVFHGLEKINGGKLFSSIAILLQATSLYIKESEKVTPNLQ